MPTVSYQVKVSLIGATVGMALIGALAMFFRRRKKRPKAYRDISRLSNMSRENSVESVHKVSTNSHYGSLERRFRRGPLSNTLRSPTVKRAMNGDVPGAGRSLSPALHSMPRSGSSASIKSDTGSASTLTLAAVTDTSHMTAEQLCELGLDSLQDAIGHWEDAIERIDGMGDTHSEHSLEQLLEHLHQLLGRAYYMRDQYEQRVFRQVSTTAALDAALNEMDREYEENRRRNVRSIAEDSSDQDSFVSALDLADLSDLDAQKGSFQHLALYEAALLELTHGTIPVRTLRTKMMNCVSDTEFVAKLHCIRLAFQELFRDETLREWFSDMGRQMISDLLTKAERDPYEFQVAYDDLLNYVKNPDNLKDMEAELRLRQVKLLTFYDVVIDFILFDAFDDLDNPPSSVITVVRNRWLSNGFKETALSTAVWSVLKAKKRLLKMPNGFTAHFYAISEHVSPVLAWGFLGPNEHLSRLCNYFKDQVLCFMRDVFSFEKVRYTTVETLADDIVRLARAQAETTSQGLASFGPLPTS